MNTRSAVLAAIACGALCSAASADWSVSKTGAWPESWPKELEPLRKQAGTIEGGEAGLVIHHIPFTKREEFEAAWPHLLKMKTKGAPIFLVRSPIRHWHFGKIEAGVLIHCPPGGVDKPGAGPVDGPRKIKDRWINTTYIELVVDGQIVDLNRNALPADTPIHDARFEEPGASE
jgi:hypothetical protein